MFGPWTRGYFVVNGLQEDSGRVHTQYTGYTDDGGVTEPGHVRSRLPEQPSPVGGHSCPTERGDDYHFTGLGPLVFIALHLRGDSWERA